MKKILLSLLLSTSSLLITSITVSAEVIDNGDGTSTINGESSTTIPINGTIGASNTDPDGGLPENDDAWINVTVPTTTTFGAKSGNAGAMLLSPTYTVKNNSGRGVSVSYDNITGSTTTSGLNLNLTPVAGSNAQVIATPLELVKSDVLQTTTKSLANLGAVNTVGGSEGGTFTYTYTGNVTKAVDSATSVSYNMTLSFKALDKGAPVTVPTN
ncbi:hypothetical protein NG844_01795 [Enterococcus faecalis]|jgi:hypothetical protein|uniref:hypothetical protein n=1 Tax=Enterococcus faecalis TaxID=1351 RepID=UPI0020908FC9|nr:hypothetical protein [Enterococcus faecalis]MCO5446154.1 hypothetical protein [Enterococcus faecalis]